LAEGQVCYNEGVMTKAAIYAVFSCSLIVFSVIFTPVYSQNSGRDLDTRNTGLLPSNPFYFVKEWSRSLQKALTFDSLKRLELIIGIFNHKGAELKKLIQVDSQKIEAINKAINSYNLALNDLTNEISSIEPAEIVNFDKTITKMVVISFRHFNLLTELKIQFRNKTLENSFELLINKIVNLIFIVSNKLENFDSFRARFQQVIGSQEDDFKELKAAIFLDRLEATVAEELRAEVNLFKKDFLLKFSVKIQQGLQSDDLEKLAVDPMIRLKILDEARKMINDQELRNQLNILRQKFLDQIIGDQLINQQEAEATIEKASSSINLLSSKTKDLALLEQAKFYFNQAEKFLIDGDFSRSFSQSVMAIGVTEEELRQLSELNLDSRSVINILKKDFNRLVLVVKVNKIQPKDQPELFIFINKAENLIARASDKKFSASQLQEIKILLANIELALKSYLKVY
jgi:antitoxin component HigA of HigAB toxin-antitoxin module